jgi:hypothetical protein
MAVAERSAIAWCRPTRRQRNACCVTVSKPPERPDPAIYSQAQQIAAGQIPSWNSPDITTNFDIPWTLMPEVQVTVRNLSPNVSAVNAQVQVSLSGYGIGLPKTPLSNKLVNLAPGADLGLSFPLPAAVMAGPHSIGFFVQIYHPNDAVEINSYGAQVLTAFQTSVSGRSVTVDVPVANPSGGAQTITLAVLPNSVGATITPASHAFAPMEQIVAKLHVHVPGGLHNTNETVSVVARDGSGALIGGASLIIWVDD